MNPHYPAVAQQAGHRCEYCHAPEAIFNFPFEIEHILPIARQGADEASNFALACRACNVHTAGRVIWTDEATQQPVDLFHPRQDRWTEHFQVNQDTGAIQGLTPRGRATTACLRMNSPVQLAARRQWMRLGLFP